MNMQRDIVWRDVRGAAIEHLRFLETGDDLRASGVIVGVVDGRAARLQYEILLDLRWRTRGVRLLDLASGRELLDLAADGEGRWRGATAELPELDGCVDVDLSATPFTNTLPIRRLGGREGVTEAIEVVYVDVSTGPTVSRVRQCYSCLSIDAASAQWHFEARDFERELTVDSEGFVVDYPGSFERIWRSSTGA